MQPHVPANDAALAEVLRHQDRLGVDTEFMRERTYFAQLCLVQISTPEDIMCLDPLADGDFDASWAALLDCEWVLHSGRQDIEVVYQATERMPAGLFDTQVAMGLLGFAPQVGYATM
ncbi:MAG: ribonuclease D, partial [Thiohalocapsa sp.]